MRSRDLRSSPLVFVFVTALVAAGCLTTSQEQKLGDEAAKQVEMEMGFVSDPKLLGYVREIGKRLAAVSERPGGPWAFHIVDMSEPNAFALPGGHIYVTRGLLALVNSEDELAGVIGHEIAHVTARHASRRIGAAIAMAPVNIVTGITGFVTGIVSPSLGSVIAGSGRVMTEGLVLAPFSRSQENEADEIGQHLAAKAGYDPIGIAHFLHTLDRYVLLLTGGEPPSFNFLASHPMTPDRVEKTTARAQEIEWTRGRAIAAGRSFLARLDGIIIGVDPARGVFEDSLFLHPELKLALTFPAGWKMRNTAAAAGALSPSEDALVALQFAARAKSLDTVIEQVRREQSDLAIDRFEINGLPAARTRVAQRGHRAVVTWIGYRNDVYAVVGQTTRRDASLDSTFDGVARSFRPIRRTEVESITENRLRLRDARAGEKPAELVKRTGSSWDADKIEVANALEEGAALERGQTIKVSIREPYSRRAL